MRVHLVLQLQDSRVGLLEVLLKLQSQIVDSNGGNWWHAALGRLRRACGGGAVQNKPQHDDSEGQDVEPRKLGENNNCGLCSLTYTPLHLPFANRAFRITFS